MLLFLTGSKDGTADLLLSKIGNRAFRFNYDIFSDYSVVVRPDSWSIGKSSRIEDHRSNCDFRLLVESV